MVSNFKRIFDEIRKEAVQIAPTYGLKPASVEKLIMGIVDLEDRNRIKAEARINQKIKGMIENATRAVDATEGA